VGWGVQRRGRRRRRRRRDRTRIWRTDDEGARRTRTGRDALFLVVPQLVAQVLELVAQRD
jgi:hypothetical protein